jgi:molybdate transport system substrate-binding protein
MRRRLLPRLALGGLCAAALGAPARSRAQGHSGIVTVFAASSLQDALRDLGAEWRRRGQPAPRLSFAASSALARQIEQGAPADLFLSADEAWMDYLAGRDLILPASRTSPLGNTLVLVAPASGEGRGAPPPATTVALGRGTDLAALLGPTGRLSTGDPAHVPVGRYAEAALRWMGGWEALAPRLARADNVRAALLLVERGEAPLGIVYGTDAAASRGAVRVLGIFPAESHPPVSYPFALTRRAAGRAEAGALLDFLIGAEAADTWRRFGFTLQQ